MATLAQCETTELGRRHLRHTSSASLYMGTCVCRPVKLKSSSMNSSDTSAKYSCPSKAQKLEIQDSGTPEDVDMVAARGQKLGAPWPAGGDRECVLVALGVKALQVSPAQDGGGGALALIVNEGARAGERRSRSGVFAGGGRRYRGAQRELARWPVDGSFSMRLDG